MIAGMLEEFEEKSGEGAFVLQNAHMLRVSIDGEIMAQKGAMVAYQGAISFEHHSAGLSRLAKKALASDSISLMHARGQGDLFLARDGYRVHIVHLQNEEIVVEPSRVLAWESGIDWNLESTGKASGLYAGGLWHMKLRGSGSVALLSHGEPLLLRCEEGAFVDKGAVVAWSGGLQVAIRRDTSFKTWTGRSSGESIQIHLQGPGWVLVQPAEGSAATTSRGSSGSGLLNIFDLLSPFS